jgi:hypothetical protein
MRKIIFLLFIVGAILNGCKRNRLEVNVSGIHLKIEIKRFEQDLFNIDLVNISDEIRGLEEKYGIFFSLFNRVLDIGQSNLPDYPEYLKAFITDPINNQVYDKIMEVYPDVNEIKEKLTIAFKHYKYYFPGKPVPDVYTYVSGFNSCLIIDSTILGIGLDLYLGSDCVFYQRMDLANYTRLKMNKNKIVSDCMYAWASTEWEFEGNGPASGNRNNVLNNMIYQGKLLYFVKAMIPDEKNEIIMGFSPDELRWCKMNEQEIWVYLIEHKLLFSTDYMVINKLIKDGPFTSYFTRESPARAAVWTGLQIVEEYMNNNPEVTLNDLMVNTEYQKILSLSKYNP